MYFTCTFKNRPKSESARNYAEHKLEHVIRLFAEHPIGVRVFFQPDGDKENIHLKLSSGRNFSAALSASGLGIYEAIDNVAAKLRSFLSKRKNKMKAVSGFDKFEKAQFERKMVLVAMESQEDSIDAAEIISLEARRMRLAVLTISAGIPAGPTTPCHVADANPA